MTHEEYFDENSTPPTEQLAPTPRTDAEARGTETRQPQFCDEWVRADFARQLERELAEQTQAAKDACDFNAELLQECADERASREAAEAKFQAAESQLQIAREALEQLNTHESAFREIESREKSATPGPWDCTHYDMETALISVHIGAEHICFVPVTKPAEKPPNGNFMAHARQDIPALLSIIRNTQAALAQITNK